jgi:hypothetical protein
MSKENLESLIDGMKAGQIVPYLGAGALADVKDSVTGEAVPADSDSLILAMNNGQPMAPRLMYEFPRAAMNIEHKRGRKFVVNFLTQLYERETWTQAALHQWLSTLNLPYVVDTNRDLQLQKCYATREHTLVQGISRIGGTDFRFRIFHYDGENYKEIQQEFVDVSVPVLFKPLGTPMPDPSFIAADADFVDYITELMGGFAIPGFMKEMRPGKQYLMLGMRFLRDTERMVMADITYAAAEPRGWVLIQNPTAKEQRYCDRMGIEIVDASVRDLLEAAGESVAGFPVSETLAETA